VNHVGEVIFHWLDLDFLAYTKVCHGHAAIEFILTAMTCVFLDIGGVLLIDGWDHHARKRAANFKLELAEMEDRHHLIFKRTRRAS
jgi:hypothetical protein